ncbi:hypothetical protein PPERSA_01596 [Pseudocohnilembus persalinus]|uniref:Uncharacterized protein n=1 Tax=Pseudocohnilembus persalinus TaxID=266149 RepID=A0A0V0QHR6_PSEPJ|nr:hypothetical protein PPERSA_01596 [Pseudocohnilembus persalinus]|eukprot:KRX01726.1 hypothetical protein PPERSA_01596 [Pseudocohnilembus persalinus]
MNLYIKNRKQMENRDKNQNVKKIQINQGYQQTVNDKIQEIFNVLKTSKLQFQEEQLLLDELEDDKKQKSTKIFDQFNTLMDSRKALYQNTQIKHNRPFIKAVPSGKLFKNEKLIIGSEIDQELETRAKSLSPVSQQKKQKYQPDPRPWKPGNYYPKLFKEETLLCHEQSIFEDLDNQDKESRNQKQKILNELIRIANSPQKYFLQQNSDLDTRFDKKIAFDQNSFGSLQKKQEQIQKLKQLQKEYQKIQEEQKNKLEEKQKSRSLKQLQGSFDTDSFAQKKERQQQLKHDLLFKQHNQLQGPMKVGSKNQYFSKRIFLENKPESRARSTSPNKNREAQWRVGRAVLQTFDDIKNQKNKFTDNKSKNKDDKNYTYEIKNTYPRIINDQEQQNKKIILKKELQQGDIKKMAEEKRFYYKPQFKDLNSNSIQNQFDQKMFNSFN